MRSGVSQGVATEPPQQFGAFPGLSDDITQVET